jgi:hypothetical protein
LKACMNRPLFLVDKGPSLCVEQAWPEMEACYLRHEEQDREMVS